MNLAQWNEEFVINEYNLHLLRPNVLFLFEILDFNPSLLMESPHLLNADNLYTVAWAYLRPVGTAQIHMSRTRLQLYKYKFKYDQEVKLKRGGGLDPRTPPVMMEFNWPKKERYPSFLEIELQFTQKSDIIIERKHISRMPWEKEIGRISFAHIEGKIAQTHRKEDNEPLKVKYLLKRWERLVNFPSELPDTKIWKFDTEALGAFKMKFSNSGKYLAVACT